MDHTEHLPDLMTTTIAELRAGLDTGTFSVRELTRACLNRIAALDRQGPALHAVLETNPAALKIAGQRDAGLTDGARHGRLHGIPVLLKDNIATTDGMQNTAGSLALAGALPVGEAFIAERLRDAGAVILGKTNLSEWADLRSPHSTNGWSARGGQVRNPFQLDRDPSGSSSGSAVAVAAGYVPVAIGTETHGSIILPANANGVVGIKPTVGLTSRRGVIPIAHHQDTVGPLARTVADVAAALTVLAAPDPDDPAVRNQDGTYPQRPADGADGIDYADPAILDADGLRGVRLGVWRQAAGFNPLADAAFDASLAALREAGAGLIDPVEMPSFDALESGPDELEVMLSELAPGIAGYLEEYVDQTFPIRILADVVAFNARHADEELRWFGQEFLIRSVLKHGLDDPAYVETIRRYQRYARHDGIDAVLDRYGVDAIVVPGGAPAPKIDLVNGDLLSGGSLAAQSVAGYPVVSVPAGSRFGLPLNLAFIGGAFAEPVLIRLAYAFEQATRARLVPTMAAPGVEPPDSAIS